jgi:streptogramin lyase
MTEEQMERLKACPETVVNDTEFGPQIEAQAWSSEGPDTEPDIDSPHRPWSEVWQYAAALSSGGIAVAVAVGAILYVTGLGHGQATAPPPSTSSPPPTPSQPTLTTLPFTGLTAAIGVAVDSDGTVYAVDGGPELFKLSAGSTTSVRVPITGHGNVNDVAVDAAHNVYLITLKSNVVGDGGGEVLELTAESTTPIVLPFHGGTTYTQAGTVFPTGLAVDAAGDVYVTDTSEKLLELPARSSASIEIPLPKSPGSDIAVDNVGNLYIADTTRDYAYGPGRGHVFELPARSSTLIELPFPDLHELGSITVDREGNVYVTDYELRKAADWSPDNTDAYATNHRVLELPAGSTRPVQLPFPDHDGGAAVASDAAGNVYVTDHLGVLKLSGYRP